MKKPIIILIFIDILLLCFNYLKHKHLDDNRDYSNDFYATIEDISENNFIYIKRLESYDTYENGLYYFCADEDTEILYENQKIEVSELKVGQVILISITGVTFDSEPAFISKVTKIKVLED